MLKIIKTGTISIAAIIIACALAYLILVIIMRPSNDRDWNGDQAVQQSASIIRSATGTTALIRNIRNFSYRSTSDYDPSYYDKEFDLGRLKRVWYVVEPFSGFAGAAHTFLSFEFEKAGTGEKSGQASGVASGSDPESEFVSISVEIRKQKGESFSAIKGLLRQYEIMYVIADEKDVIKLRSNFRKDLVYVYPVRADKAKAEALFIDMLDRANGLIEHPEFYNTLTNTCTTNIVSHVNKVSPKRVPFSKSILFPASSDRHAYDIGLIDTDLPFDAAREKFLINPRAEKYADDPNFSSLIRQQ